MSAKDELLTHLSRPGSEAMSNHHQRPTEKINSCITLQLKAEGPTIDNCGCLIEELIEIQPKEALLYNGTVDNCSLDSILRTTEGVNLNGTESSCRNGHEVICLRDSDTSVTSLDSSYSTSYDTHLHSESLDLHSSDISSNKLEALSLQNTLQALNGIDQPSPSTASSDTVTPIGLAPTDSKQTSQPVSSVPTHTRNLSQTTNQLTNLTDNFGDTSLVRNLLEGSDVKKLPDSYPVNKSGTVYSKNMPDMSQINSSNEDELLISEDVTSSTGHDTAPDDPDVKKETAFECSPNQSQCSGIVSYLASMEPDNQSPHLTHSVYPGWKLDRRESGHLYWRRDSSTLNGVDPSSRVKFRYHIEVREFESRSSEAEDLSEGDDDDMYDDNDDDSEFEVQETGGYSISDSLTFDEPSSLGSAAVIGGVAILAMIVMASYRWLLDSLQVI
ncbi:hypothetical protein B7P43_G04471 [Cryptotermes secundus]|uniref:Uncharacterized protein n=1 Tax=Cryptotermes secundus TaxID=105785 RepID=A0A2J7QW44_9NEOP|nr:uncharacterized protein LOC111864997 [Cryptotermes secundus]XP_023708439.1 uncharacterized protein LOC111864997 [Cryptotermes secundus]PNF32795.1 hypothetical protein B7P43_G04471 [Cryptotermes secundus]PNF32796.1 hypothetical protein B7P43_G04471 [Cryptotermes secundus]PNF32797.1 hypothetical protein B7P43_G04471 [Cryptotermes secundus]